MTTPTPEAIEAAARALSLCIYGIEWEHMGEAGRTSCRREATAALTAAYPFIAAQAKAEALAQLADDFDELASRASYGASEDVMETWLEAATRARAATIESEKS